MADMLPESTGDAAAEMESACARTGASLGRLSSNANAALGGWWRQIRLQSPAPQELDNTASPAPAPTAQELEQEMQCCRARAEERDKEMEDMLHGYVSGLQTELGTCRRVIAKNKVLLASKDAAIDSLRSVLLMNQGEQEQRSPLRSARGHVDPVTCQALFVAEEQVLEELIASGQELVSSLLSTMLRAVERLRSEKDRLVSASGMEQRRGEAQATPSQGEACNGWNKDCTGKEALLPFVAKLSEISFVVQMVTMELLRELQLETSALLLSCVAAAAQTRTLLQCDAGAQQESESEPKQQMAFGPGERGKGDWGWDGGTALNTEHAKTSVLQNTVLSASSWREHVELR